MTTVQQAAQHYLQKFAADTEEAETRRTKDLLKKLKPGDVFVTTAEPIRGGSVAARTLGHLYQKGYKLLQGELAHAGVYVGKGKVMEVDDAGLRHRGLSAAIGRKDVKFLRPDAPPEKRREVVAKLREMAADKRNYSYSTNPFLLKVISKMVIPKGMLDSTHAEEIEKKKFICSNFVSKAYEGIVAFHPDKKVGYITPNDIARSNGVKHVVTYRARDMWAP